MYQVQQKKLIKDGAVSEARKESTGNTTPTASNNSNKTKEMYKENKKQQID